MRDDFEFIIGNSRFCCPSLIADFLSMLCQLHSVHDTVASFRISRQDGVSQFGDFVNLGRCSPLSIIDSDRSFLASIYRELQNIFLEYRSLIFRARKSSRE
jgi:hypothetical protein